MEVSKLNLSNIQNVNVSYPLSTLQRTDTPPLDTLSSTTPNEQGCCAQLLEIVKNFIYWISSFFCSTSENLETIEGIKDYMTRMDTCFDQENGPVVLLNEFVRVFGLPLQDDRLKADHGNVFSFIIHTITTRVDHFADSKTSNLYKAIHDCFENNEGNLVLDSIVPILSGGKSIESAVFTEITSIVETFNLLQQQKDFADNRQRLSDELLSSFNPENALSPINLIKLMIESYKGKVAENRFPTFAAQFPNVLAIEIDILQQDSRFQKTAQSDFYLAIAIDFLSSQFLNLELTFQKLKEFKIDTTDTDREAIETLVWNDLNQQLTDTLLEKLNDDQEEDSCFADDKLKDLVTGLLIEGFQTPLPQKFPNYSQNIPNYLARAVQILQTNEDIQDSRLKQFLLSVGEELVRTGKLNEEEILRQCNPSAEVKAELVRIIREFNEQQT